MSGKNGYRETPSFFTDEAFFEQYLGRTSYYAALQKAVSRLVTLTDAEDVLEMGCALGHTARLVAAEHPGTDVTGADVDEGVIQKAAEGNMPGNLRFMARDMRDMAKDGSMVGYDFTYMLY